MALITDLRDDLYNAILRRSVAFFHRFRLREQTTFPITLHGYDEDELFLVHRGRFRMEFRDRVVEMQAGDVLVVPRGVEHRPVADEEVEVLLFEPAGTLNTGTAGGERTIAELERL